MSPGPDGATQLRVQRLDCIGGVDDPPHAFGESEERNYELPVAAPALCDGRILAAPLTLRKILEGSLAGGGIRGAIDSAQRLRHALAILPGGKVHRLADQMNDAGLTDRLRENGINGLGETLQAVDDGDQNVLDPTGLQFVHDAQPEFGAFGLFDPDAENLFGAVRQQAQRNIDRLVAHEAFVADLDPDGVEE